MFYPIYQYQAITLPKSTESNQLYVDTINLIYSLIYSSQSTQYIQQIPSSSHQPRQQQSSQQLQQLYHLITYNNIWSICLKYKLFNHKSLPQINKQQFIQPCLDQFKQQSRQHQINILANQRYSKLLQDWQTSVEATTASSLYKRDKNITLQCENRRGNMTINPPEELQEKFKQENQDDEERIDFGIQTTQIQGSFTDLQFILQDFVTTDDFQLILEILQFFIKKQKNYQQNRSENLLLRLTFQQLIYCVFYSQIPLEKMDLKLVMFFHQNLSGSEKQLGAQFPYIFSTETFQLLILLAQDTKNKQFQPYDHLPELLIFSPVFDFSFEFENLSGCENIFENQNFKQSCQKLSQILFTIQTFNRNKEFLKEFCSRDFSQEFLSFCEQKGIEINFSKNQIQKEILKIIQSQCQNLQIYNEFETLYYQNNNILKDE